MTNPTTTTARCPDWCQTGPHERKIHPHDAELHTGETFHLSLGDAGAYVARVQYDGKESETHVALSVVDGVFAHGTAWLPPAAARDLAAALLRTAEQAEAIG